MTKDEALKLALKALKQIDEAMPFPVAKLAIMEAEKALAQPEHSCVACEGKPKGNNNPCAVCGLAQPDPSAYWHSEFLKYNTTSDHRMMENAQGELERIKLVQTGVGIGKPEQDPVGLIESLKDAKPCCGEYETCWRACTPRGKFLGQRDAQRTWAGLTEEEMKQACYEVFSYDPYIIARAIEAKLKEKNA